MNAEEPNGGIRIRLVHEDEEAAVGTLVRAAYEGDYDLEDDYLSEIEDVAGRARVSEVWVAEDASSGRLLGTVTTPRPGERLQDDTAPGELDLRLLGVAQAARGRGVARRLMDHVFGLARDRGADRVVLHTGSTMLAPQRLYERIGFERIPEREFTFEAAGETRLLMAYGIAVTPER